MSDLSIDLGFLKLKNPVIAASGTFGYGLEYSPFIDLNRLGGIVTKGLYFSPRQGNSPPRIYETPSGMINAIGLQGIGVENFVEEILPKLNQIKTPIIVNVCGKNEEEYVSVVEFLNKHKGISAFELNISCPNVTKDGQCPALNPDDTYSVVNKVKKISSKPIITKLSPNVTDIVDIALSAQKAGSDGISLVNTFLAMAVCLETKTPCLSNVFGGLSGPCIKPLALRMVYQVSQHIDIPVIGIGGIMSAQDALEFMISGAKAVEIGTANFIQPNVTEKIIEDINLYCEQNSIDQIEQIIGTLKVKP